MLPRAATNSSTTTRWSSVYVSREIDQIDITHDYHGALPIFGPHRCHTEIKCFSKKKTEWNWRVSFFVNGFWRLFFWIGLGPQVPTTRAVRRRRRSRSCWGSAAPWTTRTTRGSCDTWANPNSVRPLRLLPLLSLSISMSSLVSVGSQFRKECLKKVEVLLNWDDVQWLEVGLNLPG